MWQCHPEVMANLAKISQWRENAASLAERKKL